MLIGTNTKDALAWIYENDANTIAKDIIKGLKSNKEQRNKITLSPQNLVVNINSITSFDYLIKKYHTREIMSEDIRIVVDIGETQIFSYMQLFNILDIQTIDVGKIGYDDALKIAIDVVQQSRESIYGVLFINKNKSSKERYINPFHPIIATAYKENK